MVWNEHPLSRGTSLEEDPEMAIETRTPEQLASVPLPNGVQPLAVTKGPDEVLDWDLCLPTPPPRPRGTIEVQLIPAGRSRPVPVADPDLA
jgi:hypothetical protein